MMAVILLRQDHAVKLRWVSHPHLLSVNIEMEEEEEVVKVEEEEEEVVGDFLDHRLI
jgi:uncharacterized membrane protein